MSRHLYSEKNVDTRKAVKGQLPRKHQLARGMYAFAPSHANSINP